MPRRGYCGPAAIAATLVALGLAIGGCGGHSKPYVASDPPQTPTPVTSASLSPSPSATPSLSSSPGTGGDSPGLPTSSPIVGISALNSAYPSAVAAEPAAIQVVREFLDAINYEMDTGDDAPVSALFTSKCGKCAADVSNIQQLLQGGHTLRGGHVHLVSVDAAYPSYNEVVTVLVTETQDAGDQLDVGGHVVQHFDSANATKLAFDLRTDQASPLIWQLDVIPR